MLKNFIFAAASVTLGYGLLADAGDNTKVFKVPFLQEAIAVDGRLSEPCYRNHAGMSDFINVSNYAMPPQPTRFQAFWSKDGFHFAFDCVETNLAAALPILNERNVDHQDRGEIYLWSGNRADTYYCFEIAALGAIHDYKTRFYREFNSKWKPDNMSVKTRVTEKGYCVEATISRASMESMGFRLESGQTWHVGVFRSDFDRFAGTPTWITWVDARIPEPDFHVFESFGIFKLE